MEQVEEEYGQLAISNDLMKDYDLIRKALDNTFDVPTRELLLSRLHILSQLVKRAKNHCAIHLTEKDLQYIFKRSYHSILGLAENCENSRILVLEMKTLIDSGSLHLFSCCKPVLAQLSETELNALAVALKDKLAKSSIDLPLLEVFVSSIPLMSLSAFTDVLKNAINVENLTPIVLSILGRSACSDDLVYEFLSTCKNPKLKLSLLMLLRDHQTQLSLSLQKQIFDLFKKESLESNGEILSVILSKRCQEYVKSADCLKFLADSLKSAKPKAFHLKLVYFAQLSDKFSNELKAIYSKEAESPSSNDHLMTLLVLLKDPKGAGVAQRSGYFLNKLFVVNEDASCSISFESQLVAFEALVTVAASKKDERSKAVDRLLELILYGHHVVLMKALQYLKADVAIHGLLIERIETVDISPATVPRFRRVILTMIASNQSIHSALFFLLLKPKFQENPSIGNITDRIQQEIGFDTIANDFHIDTVRSASKYIHYSKIEAGFSAWLTTLPKFNDDHLRVWSSPETNVPILNPSDDLLKKDKSKSTDSVKKPLEKSKAELASNEKQLEAERRMRLAIQSCADIFDKMVALFTIFVSRGETLPSLETHFEALVSHLNGQQEVLFGGQVISLVKLIGGGRLLVSEGVRFADWYLHSTFPQIYQKYLTMNDLQVFPTSLPSISPSLSEHPLLLTITLETIAAHNDSIEGIRSALIAIERNACQLSTFASRILKVICRAAVRFETLKEECLTAIKELGKQPASNDADLESLHSLLVSEVDSDRLMSLEYCSLCFHSAVPSELSTAFCILGKAVDVSIESLFQYLLKYKHLRVLVSKAICSQFERASETIIAVIIQEYRRLLKERMPEGPRERVINIDLTADDRAVIGRTLCYLPSSIALPDAQLTNYFSFVIDEALSDPSPVSSDPATAFFESSRLMLRSVDVGKLEIFIPLLEGRLASQKTGLSVDRQDMYRTWLIVLMAIISGSLLPSDPRRTKILLVLEQSLSTPSETVQMAVADGIVPLVGPDFDSAAIYQRLTLLLTSGSSMAERRGAAFGLGALFRANGLSYIFSHNFISSVLLPALAAGSTARQGGLFGIELMARYLENGLFEPLLPALLPSLLACFSDSKQDVREAGMDATAAIIESGLSVHTVKMILPFLFDPLDSSSSQWRSRVAALEWLGAMAGIKGRRALAVYLPEIVPRLTAGLSDAHAQVQRAARESLLQYGRVLRNPEIQRLFPLLLSALSDPPNNTARCLEKIIETSFTHVVDGPSLALLEPMLIRALTDRMTAVQTSSSTTTASVEVKKRAAQIIGNLGSIIDPLELIPCLPGLTTALVAALGDPVPEVRSVAARVLGVLSKVVDPRKTRVLSNVEQMCVQAVVSPDPATILGRIDRAGRAQAAAEIFAHRHGAAATAALLTGTVEEGGLRPDSLTDYVAMEGYIRLIGYLPNAFAFHSQSEQLYEEAGFGTVFQRILLDFLPIDPEPASLVDGWREACERTLRLLISRYSLHDPVSIFSTLVSSIANLTLSPRVRVLSWKLLLEEYLGRVFPPPDREINPSEDVPGSAAIMASECPTGQELMTLLPEDAVKSLQAASFLGRYDPYSSVRTVASGIWKSLSEHPVRVILDTLPSIIAVMCDLIDDDLDANHDHYLRAMEEVLERMGDRVCIPLVTNLKDTMSLASSGSVGLIRLVSATLASACSSHVQLTKNQLDHVTSMCLDILNLGLSSTADPKQSAECGETLFVLLSEQLGVERVLGSLNTGLQGLVHIRPDLVLPVLLPTLSGPEALDHIEQLTLGASVHLAPWACELIRIVIQSHDPLTDRQYRLTERIIVHCLIEQDQIVEFTDYLETIRSAHVKNRLIGQFYQRKEKTFDYLLYPLISGEHYDLVMARTISPASLLDHLQADRIQNVSLFLTKCIIPILSTGTVSDRVCSLEALLAMDLSAIPSLAMASLTGSLIRILSEKSDSDSLKQAALSTLKSLLVPNPAGLKPFHPQLLRILIICLPLTTARDALILLSAQLSRPQGLAGELEGIAANPSESGARRQAAKYILEHK